MSERAVHAVVSHGHAQLSVGQLLQALAEREDHVEDVGQVGLQDMAKETQRCSLNFNHDAMRFNVV